MSTTPDQREVEAQAKEPAGDAGKLVFFGEKAFELEDFLRAIKKSKALGKGKSGTARGFRVESGSFPCVKTLGHVNVDAKDKLKEKIKAIGAMDHKNLLPLRAYYSESGEEMLLVYDLMLGGSLHAFLHEILTNPVRLDMMPYLAKLWEVKYRIALGAARAIEYIHARGPKVCHGNIKSSNIVLSSSSFREADALVSDYYLTPSPATDPQKADVYSFGVLLLELITERIPRGGYHRVPAGPQSANLRLQSSLHEQWRFEVSDHDLLKYQDDEKEIVVLFQVAMACAARDPDMRPPMSDVRRMIEDLRVSGVRKNGASQSRPQLQPDQVDEVSEHMSAARNKPDGLLEVSERVYAPSAQDPNIDPQHGPTLDGYGQPSVLSDHTSSFPGQVHSSLLPPPPPPSAAAVSSTSVTLFGINSPKYSSTSPPSSPSPLNVPPLLESTLLNEKKEMNPQNDKLVFLGNPLMSFSFKEFLNGNAEVLGEGSIGTSYKVVLKEGTTVVVKKLRDLASSTEQFKEQMEMLGAMDHENIIPLRGYQGKSLLYDYLPMGSLSALLHGFRETGMSPLSWEIRRAIALGAARGIEYLHSQGPNVYHGSIKSSNVLLTATYDAQVSDYGLSQLKTPSIHPASEVADCQKADVYSFGVLLLELLLGKAPTSSFNLPSWVHSAIQEELDGTIDVFDPELLSYQHVEELTGLLHVAMVCVAQCPGMLPSMSEVRRMIEELFIPSVLSDWDLQLDQINELNHDASTWKLPDEALSVSENAYVSDKAFMWANILMFDFETELFGICKEFGAEITSLQMDAATSAAAVDFPNDEEEKENQIAERTKKIELQELQAGDQAAYSIIPSRDANMSIKENEAQELPVWSNTGSTSILPLMPPPKLEAAVHSAEDGSWASSGTPSESACPSLNQNFDSQCGITLDRNASAPSPTPLVSTLLNEEEVLDLPNDYGAQMEQLVPSFQQYQYASFARMIIKPPKLQAVKQQLSTSLAMSQDITSGVKTQFPNGEEGIAPVSEKEFEVNSIGGCASLLPRNGSNVKATAATHNPAQLPETMLLHLEEPFQMEDSPSSTSMSSGYDYDVISKWKAALKEAGELKGWDSDWATNRREGELVKLIVHKVVDELKKAYLLVTDCLTRLWDHEEALDILIKKKGSKKIEALSLKFDNQLQCYYANQEFERLSNLKYLEMRSFSIYHGVNFQKVGLVGLTSRWQGI
ncbi:hypothetical protein NL676_029659 [Syzygium grande]|nr:hypothetical protein NL676_029659 [Syzygium grande]